MPLHLDPTGKERLGDLAAEVEAAIKELIERDALQRLWHRDHTLWQDDPTEVADRLGWLDVVDEMVSAVGDLERFVATCRRDGFSDAVVLGMGGSSLFPEVIARTFGPGRGASHERLVLHVLDTTDPAAIARVSDVLPVADTLFVAASKSGTTVETLSHVAHFRSVVDDPGQFVVISDPGSPLATMGRAEGFRSVFENRADIGGRYSALSYFGMVPAALAGVDVGALLDSARSMADMLRPGPTAADGDPYRHPALRLAAILAAGVRSGRDKVTILVDPEITAFGLWLEQLLAESTGKQGTGVVPVVGEEVADPNEGDVYGRDRLFVSIGWHPALDALASHGHPAVELPFAGVLGLGAHVLLWEAATALCGALLGINPFDQPDVAAAKEATARVLAADRLPAIAHEPLDTLLGQLQPGDYLAIQAFVDPGSEVAGELETARTLLRDQLVVATTLGLGPRYLHSTGQLHKGGPPTGVFVQVVGDDPGDVPIPGERHGFATLKQAQAAGDLETLRHRGLRAGRVALDDLLAVLPR